MGNMYRSSLAGGGGGYSGTAQPADVLSGETFINANGPQTGSMTNNGAASGTATPSTPYTIPEGYHNGLGTVTASGTGDGDIFYATAGHAKMANGSLTNLTSTYFSTFVVNCQGKTTVTYSGIPSGHFTALASDGTEITYAASTPASPIDVTSYDYIVMAEASGTSITNGSISVS